MEKSTRKHLCEFIDKWMTEHKVSNYKLAEAIGVSNVSVRRWRIGECIPDLDLLPSICDYMGVTINEALGIECGQFSSSQLEFLSRYSKDEVFRLVCDSYRDDEKFRVLMGYIVELKGKSSNR